MSDIDRSMIAGDPSRDLAVHHSIALTLAGRAVSKLVDLSDVEATEESLGLRRPRPEPDQQPLFIVGRDPHGPRAASLDYFMAGGR